MRRRHFVVLTVVAWGTFGCNQGEQRSQGEDLTIVVEADRSKINLEEERLRERLAAFEAERKRLRDEKAQMMAEKEKIQGMDKVSIQRLKEAERRLWEKERAMWSKEDSLDKKRQELATSKDNLLSKVTTSGVSAGGGSGAPRLDVALARIEKRLEQGSQSGGTGGLAGRLDKLEGRIKKMEGRLEDILEAVKKVGGQRAVSIPRVAPSGGRVTAKESERAYLATTRKMKRRGILWGDLPPELAELQSEYKAARGQRDFARAKETVAQLDAALAALVIDSGFIDRKFNRLNTQIKKKPPNDKQAVSALLRKATQLVGDGKHQAANKELNRIFALLRN